MKVQVSFSVMMSPWPPPYPYHPYPNPSLILYPGGKSQLEEADCHILLLVCCKKRRSLQIELP